MKRNLDRILASFILSCGAVSIGLSSHAFEFEWTCIHFGGGYGETRLQLNPNGTPTTYAWTLVTGLDPTSGYGPSAAPGFPSQSCIASAVTQSAQQATLTWNSATLPTGLAAVNLALPGTPAGFSTSVTPGQDSISLVTLWAPPATWTPLGGAFAMSHADVWTVGTCPPGQIGSMPCMAPTRIAECDIALNARTVNAAGRPAWSFVEDVAGTTYGTWPDSAVARQDPTLGYVDLRGVLTHEFGHVLGLGHSLVDAPTIGGVSLLPTMFERLPAEAFSPATITVPASACTPATWSSFSVGTSASLYGREARTLQQDDISAVHGYGMSSLAMNGTGGVSGYVGFVNTTSFLPTAYGVSVVAISATDPNAVRAGSYARIGVFGAAQYEITGLAPGDYFIEVEPVGNVSSGSPSGPELLHAAPAFVLNGGCMTFTTPWRDATAELWDSAESVSEFVPASGTARISQNATRVTVVANQITQPSSVTMAIETVPTPTAKNRLRVGYGNGPASVRGVVIPSLASMGASPQLVFQVPDLDGVAGEFAVVGLALDRQLLEHALGDNQLLQIAPQATLVAFPLLGTATVAVPIQPNFVYTNLYAQALIFRANGTLEFTNVVSAFVVDR